MRVLVTGSSGQIGSYIVDRLRDEGHQAIGLDKVEDERWTDIVGNIRSTETCRKAAAQADAVIHCAAQISVQQSIEEPGEDARDNVLGTVNLLQAAVEEDIQRFVFLSSAAVYGHPESLPITEAHPLEPTSPYGAAKAAGEHYVRTMRRLHGLDTIVCRLFNVYSPRQDPSNPYSGVMAKFAERVSQGQPPIVFGDGSQTRDFVHGEDVSRWLASLATDIEELPPEPVVNLGTGSRISILELAERFIEAADLDEDPVFDDRPEGEIDHSCANVSRAQALGLEPSVDIGDGIERLVQATQPTTG